MSRFRRQHRRIDADLVERVQILAVKIIAEQQVLIGGTGEPAIALDLVLELARRPAGIAERQQRAPGPWPRAMARNMSSVAVNATRSSMGSDVSAEK